MNFIYDDVSFTVEKGTAIAICDDEKESCRQEVLLVTGFYHPGEPDGISEEVVFWWELSELTDNEAFASMMEDWPRHENLCDEHHFRAENEDEHEWIFKELLKRAERFDACADDLCALANFCRENALPWNGESWDVSLPGEPSGSRSLFPVFGEPDEDGDREIVGYEIR